MTKDSLNLIPLTSIDIDFSLDRDDYGADSFEIGATDLAQSIKKYGLLQPIVLKPKKNGRYSIIAGKRRFTAFKILNGIHEPGEESYSSIPAIVMSDTKDSPTDNLLRTFYENFSRKDISNKGFARTFCMIAGSMLEDGWVDEKTTIERGRAAAIAWLYAKKFKQNQSEKKQSIPPRDLIVIEGLVQEMGLSVSTLFRKLQIFYFDEYLEYLHENSFINYSMALRIFSISKKNPSLYQRFVRDAIGAVKDGKDIDPIVERLMAKASKPSSAKGLDKASASAMKKKITKILSYAKTLDGSDPVFLTLKEKIDEIEKLIK